MAGLTSKSRLPWRGERGFPGQAPVDARQDKGVGKAGFLRDLLRLATRGDMDRVMIILTVWRRCQRACGVPLRSQPAAQCHFLQPNAASPLRDGQRNSLVRQFGSALVTVSAWWREGPQCMVSSIPVPDAPAERRERQPKFFCPSRQSLSFSPCGDRDRSSLVEFTGRRCQSFRNRPSEEQSLTKRILAYETLARPFAHGHGSTEIGKSPVPALVPVLFCRDRPTDVSRLIVAVVLHALDGVFRRWREANVFEKILKGRTPPVADANPPTAPTWIVRVALAIAARLHRQPSVVLFRVRQAMSSSWHMGGAFVEVSRG